MLVPSLSVPPSPFQIFQVACQNSKNSNIVKLKHKSLGHLVFHLKTMWDQKVRRYILDDEKQNFIIEEIERDL